MDSLIKKIHRDAARRDVKLILVGLWELVTGKFGGR